MNDKPFPAHGWSRDQVMASLKDYKKDDIDWRHFRSVTWSDKKPEDRDRGRGGNRQRRQQADKGRRDDRDQRAQCIKAGNHAHCPHIDDHGPDQTCQGEDRAHVRNGR